MARLAKCQLPLAGKHRFERRLQIQDDLKTSHFFAFPVEVAKGNLTSIEPASQSHNRCALGRRNLNARLEAEIERRNVEQQKSAQIAVEDISAGASPFIQ